MTKYEYTRIKGLRMQQLANGWLPYVSVQPDMGDLDHGGDGGRLGMAYIESVFLREMKERKSALVICREDAHSKWSEAIAVCEMDYDAFLLVDINSSAPTPSVQS